MSCGNFEQLIALYVEEDLSAVERGRVEGHLRECSGCWDLAEDLKESQALFKSIRQDVPNATALSALRERVLGEVSGLDSMSWFERFLFGGLRRKAALAGLVLVAVGSGALWLARLERVTSIASPKIAVAPPAPPVVSPPPPSEPVPAPKRRPIPSPSAEERKQVAIKFVTDDPNVIIYWLVDEKGD